MIANAKRFNTTDSSVYANATALEVSGVVDARCHAPFPSVPLCLALLVLLSVWFDKRRTDWTRKWKRKRAMKNPGTILDCVALYLQFRGSPYKHTHTRIFSCALFANWYPQ